jgi:uncharacterized membrane protein YfcA
VSDDPLVPRLARRFLDDLVTLEYFSGAVLIGVVAFVAGLATEAWFIVALGLFLVLLGGRMWVRRRGGAERSPQREG